jgi:uncharacterized membrane-anchored protein YitT (DUF2179 family)
MNKILKKVIERYSKNSNQSTSEANRNLTNYQLIKGYSLLLVRVKNFFADYFLIILGILSAGFGFKGFLSTNRFIDGGATRISLLIANTTSIPLPLLIIVINLPFVLLGYKILEKNFVIKTIVAISGLSLCLAFVTFPNITDDKLLVAVFGGFFLGAGIGLTIRGGAVIDGTEILAIWLSKKFGTTIGDIIIVINIIIFSIAAYFLSIEIALYSMITYVAASKTLDFIIEGIDEYIGVTIISSQNEKIRKMVIGIMGRGVTVYNGKRGYGKSSETKETEILYIVITRVERNKLKQEAENIAPHAFMVMNTVKETRGGMIKKRPLSH